MLGRRIAARPRPPATVRDLEIALLEEWNSIPQSLINNLIASMANRERGCSSPVVKLSDHGRHVMSSSPAPLKNRRVGELCTLNLSTAQTSLRWCGVVFRREGASSGVVFVT
ncbi:hypothetical protein TNCV_2631551 [Trichonephila clavipes]|nr:hypothetical protein TNCV_2631551 [Trichonephila clavipes]